MRISVIIPTITGREGGLAQTVQAYLDRTPGLFEIITPKDHPSWAAACNDGRHDATGDILHFGADDLEPLPGWSEAMLRAIAGGVIPAAQIWDHVREGDPVNQEQDGLPGELTAFSRVPSLPRDLADAIGDWPAELHYYADNWVSDAALLHGWPCAVTDGYGFIHHWAQTGRLDQGDWVGRYLPLYEAAKARLVAR